MSELDQRLNRCFAAVFPGLALADIPGANVESLATWDSVATVTLVSAVEEEFGIEVSPEELECFVSYASIFEVLKKTPHVS